MAALADAATRGIPPRGTDLAGARRRGSRASRLTATIQNGGSPPQTPTPAAIAAHPPATPPRVDVEIPFTIEFDVAPLLSAVAGDAELDGRWFGLRERFAHFGLAQGFDELLCLPHLSGVEPLLHQIETRKVLKQFRCVLRR
jgi:hypothetical protein